MAVNFYERHTCHLAAKIASMKKEMPYTELLAHLRAQFDEIELLNARLAAYSSTQLEYAPAPSAWSAGECLQHLNSYAKYYMPLFERLAPSTHHPELYRPGWLGNLFYDWMKTDTSGMPSKTMSAPPGHRPRTEAASLSYAQYMQWHTSLKNVIQQRDTLPLAEARIPISIGKWVKLKSGDVLLFYQTHIIRHLHQAIRAAERAKG
jgi:hypothetical protein